MKIAKEWLKENRGVEMPEGEISGEWFMQNRVPMVVSCVCCKNTMILPSALIDDDGNIFCGSCGE